MLFERNLESNIFELSEQLRTHSYVPGPYDTFRIHDPKERRIHKASVTDRLVHQAIVNAIEPIFEKRFIFDSYSCRKGKGVHAALYRLQTFLRKASANNKRAVYALKLDVRKFFDSVDHQILISLLRKRLPSVSVMDLLICVIESFSKSDGKGLPLGNVTSQLFANVYLHELDWFIKQHLRRKHYFRYCDDFVIVGNHREELLNLVPIIEEFINKRLRLGLHPHKISVSSWTQGIDFVGYVLMPHGIVLRTKTKRRMLALVNATNLPSYLGLCSHANSHEISQLAQNIVGSNQE